MENVCVPVVRTIPPPLPELVITPEKVLLAFIKVSSTLPNVTPPEPDRLTTEVPPELVILKVPLAMTALEFDILPPLPKANVALESIVVSAP